MKDSRKADLADFLPRHKITCQKCGETVRCHYTWFDRSTVLCPSCYAGMHEWEIRRFHHFHYAPKPRKEVCETGLELTDDRRESGNRYYDDSSWTRNSSVVNSGGCWSAERIMGTSAEDLVEAVKNGSVSRVRAKIELRRRLNVEY